MGRKGKLLLIALLALAGSPAAGLAWDGEGGWWNLELTAGSGFHSGSEDRDGDLLVTGTVTYEVPASPRLTIGCRFLPLFIYDPHESSAETVWGGGLGLAPRFYLVKGTYRGWFGEVETNILGHVNRIAGNSSNLNFLVGAGLGYRFQSRWHGLLKVEHISNASLGSRNLGSNLISGAVGFSF